MKKILSAIFAIVVFAIAAPASALSFSSFGQQIDVGSDGMLTVSEKVIVFFDSPRHGIYRDIPTKYKTEAGNPFNLRVKIVSVVDPENDQTIPFTASNEGDRLRVKIGDPASTVTGKQSYVVRYQVSRALLFLKDQDQLYWNVATEPWGDLGWPETVNASVSLPLSISKDGIKTRCFTGLGAGAPENCNTFISEKATVFSTQNTPLTIVVGWPKGFVKEPTFFGGLKEWLADNWIVGWPIIAFVLLFMLWFKKGRDPKMDGALVVRYDPPESSNPAEVGVLFDQKANEQEITATVVHLAVKGYLNISESAEKGLFGSTRSYSFELKKDISSDASLADYERETLNGIFGHGAAPGAVVGLDELKNVFYKTAAVVKKEMDMATVKRGWFAKSPTAVRATYMGVGFGYLILVLFVLKINGSVALVSAILPAVFALFFGYFMPARSLAGTKAYAHALGFKEYLGKAETYRLKWEEKENIFERFLPYAMVFGVVDKWAKAFEGMNMQPPSWYRGGTMNGFSPILFAHTLTDATSTIGKSLTVMPSSKGGGGFGGGGFGGGGFGGGGGGSW